MKKIILSVVVICTSLFSSSAQDDTVTSTDVNYGVKAGYTTTILKVTLDGDSASDDVSGFYIGAFAEIGLSEKFSIQPEVQYATYSQDGASTGILLVPVLAKYNPDDKFSLFAGPQFDYLINKEDSEGFKRLGFGLALGASYDIAENVILDIRYTLGLSNRLDGDLEDFEEFDFKVKFNYFQVGLGYRF